jgi:hypothetical protein
MSRALYAGGISNGSPSSEAKLVAVEDVLALAELEAGATFVVQMLSERPTATRWVDTCAQRDKGGGSGALAS